MLTLNHIHLRSTDPRKTAAWYVDTFGAKITWEGETPGGALVLRLNVAGIRLNISATSPGESLPAGPAEPHLGLDHYAFNTDDLEGLLARLQDRGVEVVQPLRTLESGAKMAFIQAPDDVRIELMQPPA